MVGPIKKPWLPDFLLLGAVWGATFLFMRLAVADFGPLPTAALRAAIGALTLLPLLWWRQQAGALKPHWPLVFTAGVFNASIPSAGLAYALLALSTGMTAIVNATVPLFGALLAWVWLGQRPRRAAATGLAVGFIGVVTLAWDGAGLRDGVTAGVGLLAVLCAMAAAGSGAFSALFARRYLEHVPPLAMAAGSQVGATLGLLLPAWWLWPANPPGAIAWLGVLGAGVVCTGLGYLLFFRVVERAGPNRALTVTFVMPLFAMVYGLLFLQEPISLGMLGCAALIIGGTALSTGLLARRAR